MAMPPPPSIPLGFGKRSTWAKPAECPCGGGAYASCCGHLIAGKHLAVTAQQLMRSRYSAFALATRDPQAIEHLLRTHPEAGQPVAARRKALMESCRTIQWTHLDVLDFQNGGALDQLRTQRMRPESASGWCTPRRTAVVQWAACRALGWRTWPHPRGQSAWRNCHGPSVKLLQILSTGLELMGKFKQWILFV